MDVAHTSVCEYIFLGQNILLTAQHRSTESGHFIGTHGWDEFWLCYLQAL